MTNCRHCTVRVAGNGDVCTFCQRYQPPAMTVPELLAEVDRAIDAICTGAELATSALGAVRELHTAGADDWCEEKLVLLRVIDSQAREIEQLQQGQCESEYPCLTIRTLNAHNTTEENRP